MNKNISLKVLCNPIESDQEDCVKIGMIPAGNQMATCEDYSVGFKISNSTCACPEDLLAGFETSRKLKSFNWPAVYFSYPKFCSTSLVADVCLKVNVPVYTTENISAQIL